MAKAKNVNDYIKGAPKDVQERLNELRKLIKKVAPTAEERISYSMPFYDYHGRLVYFAHAKGYVGLYIPPPIIFEHQKVLASYTTTKSAIHLPNTKPLPATLIKKLIVARMKHNESKTEKTTSDFPDKLANPALRALRNAKIFNLKDLSNHTEKELAKFHGIGPNGIKLLKTALQAKKLSFK